MQRAILFLTFTAVCGAQTTVNGGRDYKGTLKASGSVSAVDFSGAGGTAPAKAGTSASRPTACTQGQIYFATDVAAGQNLYFCTATGTPGVWSQMSGNTAGAMASGTGVPAGSCAPPALYIDTTNQDLWFCGAANSWKRPTTDTSGLPTLGGANTWTGYSNLANGQWRPPESTVANLPPASGNTGKVFMVTDAAAAGSCSTGGGALRELCRANNSTYECVGGCGSAGGGGSGSAAYISSLISGPDLTRTIPGSTHGFATTALLVAVYDNASPRNAINVTYAVNPATYDVVIAFASPQSNYYVVVNGGAGPQGPVGPQGPGGGGTPGGTNGQMQVNSGGSFAGQTTIFSGGSVVQRAVECTSGTTSYTALTAAAPNQEITIQTGISGNVRWDQVTVSETTQFAGTTGLTVSMGRPGTNNHEMTGAQVPLMVSSGDANFWTSRPIPPQLTGTYSIVLNFAVTAGNVNAATAGSLTWEACGYSVR